MHRNARAVVQPLRKFASVLSLAALVAAHVERQPDQDQRNPVILNQARERIEVVPNTRAMQRLDALRGHAEFVADSQSNSLFPEIQREHPALARSLLRHLCHYRRRKRRGSLLSALTQTTLPTQHKPGNAALRVLAFAAVVALLYFGRIFLITLLIAVMLAFLLEPGVRLVMKLRVPRGLASFIVCSIALLGIYLLGLGIYTEILALIEDLPAYSDRVNQLVDQAANKVDDVEKNTYELLVPKRYRDQPLAPVQGPRATGGNSKRKGKPPDPVLIQPPGIPEVRIHREPTPLWSYAYSYVRSFYNVALMTSFVPFLVYFMLSWRDHLRRSYLYMFDASDRQIASRSWERVAEVARAYVIGNAILGALLGVASALFFIIMELPYAILAGAISGFLSLVPYVGVPLAIVPPVIAALPKYSSPSVYVIIAVVVALFHLIGLNLLYPKLVGARVHLNPLAVTVALMFWGTMWGGVGLLLAIPITAALKAVCDNITSLNAYGKLLGD